MEEVLNELAMTPEERRAEQEERDELRRAREEREAERARQEAVWKAKRPAEWEEWCRVRLLLNGPIPFGDDPFDFPDFMQEVGRRPSPRHIVVRPDETQPYQQGNLTWQAPAPAVPKSPYLNLHEAAAFLGVSPRTIYNNRKHIPSLPGFRRLMFDPKELETLRASPRFMSKRVAGRRRSQPTA